VLQGLEVLLVVEVRVGLPVDEDALETKLLRQRVGLVQPVDIGLLTLLVLGGHPGDLLRRPGLAVDAGVRKVVVGALHVEPDVQPRSGDPAHVLPVRLVAGFRALPLYGHRVPAEALVGRVEELSLDLGRFRWSGGKLIIWHGWGDEAIPPAGTLDYYQRL